jgi:V8-like Glu-specific endopeptidase
LVNSDSTRRSPLRIWIGALTAAAILTYLGILLEGGKSVKSVADYPALMSLAFVTGNAAQHECGAVLVRSQIAVTAAHCIHNFAKEMENHTIVAVGGTLKGTAIDPKYVQRIAAGRCHPEYGSTNDVDLGLVRFSNAPGLPPVSLASPGDESTLLQRQTADVGGWTRIKSTQYFEMEQLRVNNAHVCKTNSGRICGGWPGSGLLHGDSGGGLFDLTHSTVAAVAIERVSVYSEFVRIAPLLTWIEKTITELSTAEPPFRC